MREIVIVIRDLYLEPELAAPPAADAAALEIAPGIEQLARFGDKASLPEGWRAWSQASVTQVSERLSTRELASRVSSASSRSNRAGASANGR